jgi:hypothetical protein
MANRWIDSLGRYGGTKSYMLNGSSSQAWAQVDAGWTLSSANPRTGAWHLRLVPAAGNTEARRVFGDQLGAVYFGQAIYLTALPFSEHFIGGGGSNSSIRGMFLAAFRDQANGNQVTCWLGTDGAIVVYRGGDLQGSGAFTGALLGRTIPVIGTGAYNHIEYFVTPHNSAGALEIRVNEVTRLNLTGIDTVNTANVEVSQVATGVTGNCTLGVLDMADVYVNDTVDDGSACNDFIGDVKAGLRMVASDTAQADFALSAGISGFALLNETPPVDSSYISLAGTTGRSDFGIDPGPANTTEILTARPFIRAQKDDAGTCTMAPNMSSGGTLGTVDDQSITTGAGYVDNCVPLDPDIAAPWTLTTLDAALEVIERTA